MNVENKNPDEQRKLRQLLGSKAALWIDDATGQIVELPIGSRGRNAEDWPVCHGELDRHETRGRLDFKPPPASLDLVGSHPKIGPLPVSAVQRHVPLAASQRHLLTGKGGDS